MPLWLAWRGKIPTTLQFRALSTASKSYSNTLHLPRTSFPQWADPKKSEAPFRHRTTEELYSWQKDNVKGPLFVLHDGPPYANGNLHMGHALNKIIKDMITRYHLLQGRRVNYIPGWDCHGLPIENKALKELKKRADSLPPDVVRSSAKAVAEREIGIQRKEFQELGVMADWSTEGTYRTLDKEYELDQLRLFQRMVEKSLIYRSFRPVHYSPSSRSALAEAELTYRDDHVSHSVYVTFRLDSPSSDSSSALRRLWDGCKGRVKLAVWTTTPWTLTANMGIAVNQDMVYTVLELSSGDRLVVATERLPALASTLGPDFKEVFSVQGSELIGCTYEPLFPSMSKQLAPYRVIPATFVSAESGTGLVHCAPAHGAEDYSAFHSLGLLQEGNQRQLICHVDGKGRFSDSIRDIIGENNGGRLAGLDVLGEGTNAVVEILRGMDGVLLKEESIKHRYPYDWKTDKPIIVTATSQWFASLESIKKTALEALKHVKFHPPESRRRLESFVTSRSEWCISRQRRWGVPIPSLHHIPSGDTILDSASLMHILSVLEREGPEHWWKGPVSDFIPPALLAKYGTTDPTSVESEWAKGTDTMDVWFDSGSSWAMLRSRGIQTESEGVPAYADFAVEGSDQHRGWFQSMLLTAMAANEADAVTGIPMLPYRALVTHGMVLDQEGKKMSKSLGNIISPMTVIFGGKDKKKDPAYGADVLRFWAASVEFWRDAPLGPTVLAQSAETLRKIRNSARFILGNIGDEEHRRELKRVNIDEMSIADRYVLRELEDLETLVRASFDQLNFARAVQAISRFANVTLSAFYFDITKDILYAERVDSVARRAVVTVLERVLERLTLLLAPVTPHLAEEIYWHARGGASSTPKLGSSTTATTATTAEATVAAAAEATVPATSQSVFAVLRWPELTAPSAGASADAEDRRAGSGITSTTTTNTGSLLAGAEDTAKVDVNVDMEKEREEMNALMKMRERVLGLLERARGDKKLRSSLEARVEIVFRPSSDSNPSLKALDREDREGNVFAVQNQQDLNNILRKHENFLKTLFIVSDVTLENSSSAVEKETEEWSYSTLVSPSSSEAASTTEIELRVCPARGAKCPRCWTFTREEEAELCARCTDAIAHL